jgi:hypothetical protein
MFTCDLHGENCPNELGGPNGSQPVFMVDGEWRSMVHGTPTSTIRELLEFQCPISQIFAAISILRRSHREPSPDFTVFEDLLKNNLWYLLNKASDRVLVSILDTLADNPKTSGPGTAAVVFLHLERLAKHTSKCRDPLKPGESRTLRLDTTANFLNRFRNILFPDPITWAVVYEIFRRELRLDALPSDNPLKDHIFKRHDRVDAINISSDTFTYPTGHNNPPNPSNSLVSYAQCLLRPSIVNSVYYQGPSVLCDLNGKYRTIVKADFDYGEGLEFPTAALSFLTARGVTSVLDFGCGRNFNRPDDLDWSLYDPFPPANVMPKQGFDAVVSYDVLDNLVGEELIPSVKWLGLYAEKHLIVGVATNRHPKSFGAISDCWIRNTDPENYASRTPDWWETTLLKELPEFELSCRDCFDIPDGHKLGYTVFYLSRRRVK